MTQPSKEEAMVTWRMVNGDGFEYAIQQGPHGDEFVKLLDGSCLRRSPSQPVSGETITVPFNPCLAKLSKDEPFFVLLGRDNQASMAIQAWADYRDAAEGISEWTQQAREIANSMRAYRIARKAGLASTDQAALSPSQPVSGETGIENADHYPRPWRVQTHPGHSRAELVDADGSRIMSGMNIAKAELIAAFANFHARALTSEGKS